MTDFRLMFDSEYLYSFHLGGREVTITMSKVEAGELVGEGGRKAKKPLVYFEGKEKPLALNKTNARTIAALYGNDTKGWIGKKIAIYPTTTQMGGKVVDCIRVRPNAPRGRAAPQDLDENRPPPDPERDGR